MNDTLLRKKLIRLAHAQPELRAELLPLLASKTARDKVLKAVWEGKELHVPGDPYGIYWRPGDSGEDFYDWTQTTELFNDKDFLEWRAQGKTYRIYMNVAWPIQVAGPRIKLMHTFNAAGFAKAIPHAMQHLVDPEYRS